MVDLVQRKMRWDDDVRNLGIASWDLAEEAIRAGRIGEALELVEYARFENKTLHDGMVHMAASFLDYIANNMGEEEIEKAWGYETDTLPVFSRVEDLMRFWLELVRGHFPGPTGKGSFTVTEEADRYIVALDPCGSGGMLERTGKYGVTKKPHPWSWGKTGVLYYCTHCCIMKELNPLRSRGYPVIVSENVDRRDGPCIQIYYKSPELIPEEYFTRLGFKKDMSKVAQKKRQQAKRLVT